MAPTTPPTMAPVCEEEEEVEDDEPEDAPADGLAVEICVVSTTVDVCPLWVILLEKKRSEKRRVSVRACVCVVCVDSWGCVLRTQRVSDREGVGRHVQAGYLHDGGRDDSADRSRDGR